jgi:hypothetical protein
MIGAVVVWLVVLRVIQEVIRSLRQSHRVATIYVRTHVCERRPPTLREWAFSFRQELFSSYDSLIIAFIEIPHDPSKPLRARLHG